MFGGSSRKFRDRPTERGVKNFFNDVKAKIIAQYGNNALYDDTIHRIGKELIGDKFIGVYSQDLIPLEPESYYGIANTDFSGEPGTHWVALYKKGKTIYVYDSFARPTNEIMPIFYKKARDNNITIIDINREPDQYVTSQVCGPISLSWLLSVEKHGLHGGSLI